MTSHEGTGILGQQQEMCVLCLIHRLHLTTKSTQKHVTRDMNKEMAST